MKRAEAISQGMLVMNFLSFYEGSAYLTMDISKYSVRIHFIGIEYTDDEVRKIADKLGNLRVAESQLEYIYNEKTERLTFDVIWDID